MRTTFPLVCGLLISAIAVSPALAKRAQREADQSGRTSVFDDKIAELAKKHNVPERLVHRVIMRESRYRPTAVHAGNYGLMQIRLGTARTMGYAGSAMGLCDGVTNLTYAVPYLANAYAVADRDEDRAVRLYASGFYYVAKRQGALSKLQVARVTEPVADGIAYASAPTNPIAALFGALAAPANAAVAAANAESAAARAQMEANAGLANADDEDAVPLPPRRPRAYSTKAFIKFAMKQDPVAQDEAR